MNSLQVEARSLPEVGITSRGTLKIEERGRILNGMHYSILMHID